MEKRMFTIEDLTLYGKSVQLEPMNSTHYESLYNIAQNETIWKFHGGLNFETWFQKALNLYSDHEQIPFVVRNINDNKIVGSTRFYDISLENRRLKIGYTWYTPEVWGSQVNPESKLLLLSFAFEKVVFNRVEFNIDARNLHSQAAVKKLGAVEEGVLRQHMILKDGFVRDTVVFSILRTEWAGVKLKLVERLRRDGASLT